MLRSFLIGGKVAIEDDMLHWLIREEDNDAVKVVAWCERQTERPICGEGTCWDEYTVVGIEYVDKDGRTCETWYEGELSEFIRELTNAP